MIDYFVQKSQHKLLTEILKSDPIMKKMIENIETKIKKNVKFQIHPLLILYDDINCAWGIKSGRINIPLDRSKNILPYNKDQQIFTLAHELIHLQEKDYKKKINDCEYKHISCMFQELRADLFAIKLLKELNVEIGKQIFKNQKQKFWAERLKIKVDVQCERCHQIIQQGICPKLPQILEYLKAITSEAELKLIADPVSSKNGVYFFRSLKSCPTGRVFTISFFVAQPRRAWAMPNSRY